MLTKKTKIRGQIALEFMMTYGWAILALMTVIAGLAFFMPHTASLTNDKCLFSPSVPCLGVRLTAENLTVVLRNGMSQTIYNLQANMTTPENNDCIVSNTTLRADERLVITCDNSVLKLSSDTKIKMALTYKKIKGGYDQIALGDIYAKYK